ncbi:hypothetical protein CLV24_11855 [Pontibacter ummariensis]|uniref:SIMPL domain-containing protein n=1 Tax=Pontibacter ummariensis TaxID=1610492 RepID=A0A239IPX6_9BACT|nr:SIMPL domain-containing protein [Pontibacter ummariensis]PRY09716.1 hypothetical protein CLV24_11855 [Pontibacter ummariensis]SNS95268.1 hypothetical protein SAMN06296052_11833 [Pontibacter ummariensis]
MKKVFVSSLALVFAMGALAGCGMRPEEEEYLQVIGEYEQPMPDAGFRLNLSYNGPLEMRKKFMVWADSLQKQVPGMMLTNESIFVNYMPEQMGQEKIRPEMFQTSVTYNINVPDSATYSRIMQDALAHHFPFSVNVSGTFVDPSRRADVQQELLEQAVENARAKLRFLNGGEEGYEIVSVEELDNVQPYGPDYYDFNRRMVSRVKVKARLND